MATFGKRYLSTFGFSGALPDLANFYAGPSDPASGDWAAWAAPGEGAAADPRAEATSVSVGATGNPYIDGLLAGSRWSGSLTYSFPQLSGQYPNPYTGGNFEPTTNFNPVTFQQREATRAILSGATFSNTGNVQSYGSLAAITNVDVNENGGIGNGLSGAGDIRLGESTQANPTAYAYYPSNNSAGVGGDVWFGTNYVGTTNDYRNPVLGGYAYHTHIHELGHALGLKHSQETGGVSNVAVPADRDAIEFTVMSYRSYVGGPTSGYTYEQWGAPQTFMMEDIRALQTMYGADYTTYSGNTVYRWNPSTGQMSISENGGGFVGQGTPGGNRVFLTIWDGNGNDTYDMSNYSGGVSIDLRPGQWSITSSVQRANLGSGHFANGNVYNAYLFNNDPRSLIENAIGGAGSDTLIGNQASNRLDGGGGSDTLTGGAAGDVFVYGPSYGSDIVTDFVHLTDQIDFRGFSALHSFNQIMSFASQVGANTVFNFGGGNVLTLQNVNMSTLTAGDFLFNAALPVLDDFNGDRTSDVLWYNGSGVINWTMQNGVPVGGNIMTTTLGPGWAPIRNGDFNGDGTSDVLLRDNSGSVVDWIVQNGTVVAGNVVTTGLGSNWRLAGVGDFNFDGTADIAWQDTSGTVVNWIMQNGQAVAGNIVTTGLPLNWRVLDVGDFNGDGTADMLVRDNAGTVVDWIMQNGRAVDGHILTTGLPSNWNMVGIGDFNGDGTDDILWQDDQGTVVNWIMQNGVPVAGNIVTTGLPAGWQVVNVGDYNHDGTDDILLRNGSTVVDWIIQNGRAVDGHILTTSLNPGWLTV